MMRYVLIALFAMLIVANNASAASPTLEGTHKAWNVFSMSQGGEKVCYMSSTLKKEDGTFKRRSEPYLLVTYRPGGKPEVSVSSGYPYKSGSDVELSIDGKRYQTLLFTSPETPKVAWAKTAAEDKAIIANMKKGTEVTIKGHSRLKTHSKDTYSLLGFTRSYALLNRVCG